MSSIWARAERRSSAISWARMWGSGELAAGRRHAEDGTENSPAASAVLISSKDLPAAIWLATHRAWAGAWSAQKLCLPGFSP